MYFNALLKYSAPSKPNLLPANFVCLDFVKPTFLMFAYHLGSILIEKNCVQVYRLSTLLLLGPFYYLYYKICVVVSIIFWFIQTRNVTHVQLRSSPATFELYLSPSHKYFIASGFNSFSIFLWFEVDNETNLIFYIPPNSSMVILELCFSASAR